MPCRDRLAVSDFAGEHIASVFRIKQSTLLGHRDPEDGATRLIRNISSYLPVVTAYPSKKTRISARISNISWIEGVSEVCLDLSIVIEVENLATDTVKSSSA
jgi:hypothetical protein